MIFLSFNFPSCTPEIIWYYHGTQDKESYLDQNECQGRPVQARRTDLWPINPCTQGGLSPPHQGTARNCGEWKQEAESR